MGRVPDSLLSRETGLFYICNCQKPVSFHHSAQPSKKFSHHQGALKGKCCIELNKISSRQKTGVGLLC